MGKSKKLKECKTYQDFDRYAHDHNGYRQRQTGSHAVYGGPEPGIAVVPNHGSQDIPVGTRTSIVKQFIKIGLVLAPFMCGVLYMLMN